MFNMCEIYRRLTCTYTYILLHISISIYVKMCTYVPVKIYVFDSCLVYFHIQQIVQQSYPLLAPQTAHITCTRCMHLLRCWYSPPKYIAASCLYTLQPTLPCLPSSSALSLQSSLQSLSASSI